MESKKENIYDLIIIGGGPCGSTAARIAAQLKLNTLLIDHASIGRDKPCGGAITPKIKYHFPEIQSMLNDVAFSQRMGFDNNEDSFTIHQTEPLCYMVSRNHFDAFLVESAQKNGCEFRFNTRVKSIIEKLDFVSVILQSGEILRSKYLFGADGVISMVRSSTYLTKYWNKKQVAHAYTQEFSFEPNEIEKFYENKPRLYMHFNFQQSDGYGWIFVKRNVINVGFGEITGTRTMNEGETIFLSFLKNCIEQKILPSIGLAPIRSKTWLIPIKGPLSVYTTKRILLGGDAAGFVNPLSGEGIVYAMLSGKFIAEAISKYSTTPTKVIKYYKRQCEHHFGKTMRIMGRFQKKLIPMIKKMSQFIILDAHLQQVMIDYITGDPPLYKIAFRNTFWFIISIFKYKIFPKFKRKKVGNPLQGR